MVEGIKLGRILITTNVETLEPELHYCSLPDLVNTTIILQDPTIATGAVLFFFLSLVYLFLCL